MTAVFYDIYLFSISTLFKILEWANGSYVGSVLKKSCQKVATADKGFRKRNNPLDKIEGEGGCWGMRMRRREKG